MQTFLVVHLLDEMGKLSGDVVVGLIVRQMYFLVLQRLEERFHVSVVVRIACSRHADLDLRPFEQGHVPLTRILHAAIGVMNTSQWRFTGGQSATKSCQTQVSIDAL